MGVLDFLEDSDSALVVPPSQVEVVHPPLTASKSVVPAPQNTGQLTVAQEARLSREEKVEGVLRDMENEILRESLAQISYAQGWAMVAKELDPEDLAELPQDWVEREGLEKAKEHYRVARAATMKSADAPVALKENARLAIGIMKARAHEKTGPRILNLSLVEMPNVVIQFPEQEVK